VREKRWIHERKMQAELRPLFVTYPDSCTIAATAATEMHDTSRVPRRLEEERQQDRRQKR
jgi:hypothetical protein